MIIRNLVRNLLLTTSVACPLWPATAWDYENHRVVNQLALASLPTNFPVFVRTPAAGERVAFLAGEMDRWRNSPDVVFRHSSGPDHYIDVEELDDYGLDPLTLPVFRYDFVAKLAVVRQANPDKFRFQGRDEDHTRELAGLLPWAIAESYGKLKSVFSYLKAYEENGGTPEEIANAQANILYCMGVMGHLAGDASQPLHTTRHHHGWEGDNPNGYSTNSRIHSWIDGGYLAKTGGLDLDSLLPRTRPARLVQIDGRDAKPEEMFQAAMLFILEQHNFVERLYKMEKEGEFSGDLEVGRKGKAFLEGQILKSGQFLADLWWSAYQQAPPDTFLKGQLAKRQTARKK